MQTEAGQYPPADRQIETVCLPYFSQWFYHESEKLPTLPVDHTAH
jgi:hypothetical protein